jgi:hypothetical protein
LLLAPKHRLQPRRGAMTLVGRVCRGPDPPLARGPSSATLGCSRAIVEALYGAAVNLFESEGWIRGPDPPRPGPERLYNLALTGRDRGCRRHRTVAQQTLQVFRSQWKRTAHKGILEAMGEHCSTVLVGPHDTPTYPYATAYSSRAGAP